MAEVISKQQARHCHGSSAWSHQREPYGSISATPEASSITYTQWIIRTVKDFLFMVDCKLFTVPEARLVESVQVGEMDPEPHETALAEWLLDTECEQSSSEIVADGVQMRRHGIGTTSEIEVVRDVEHVVQILLKCQPRSYPFQETYGTRNLQVVVEFTPL